MSLRVSRNRANRCIINRKVNAEICGKFDLRLEVLDINDNKPVFPHDNISLDISENSMLGQSIRLESATDRDPDFGIVSYELKGFKPIFELNEERNEDGTIIPSLRLKKELDREKTAEYQVILCLLRDS